ncbi:MAG: UvrABC system protein C [Rhodothermaceae bacterium]|nr:MAG: UvrABC system protein C [Rhodothermaceae bacterium]
MDRMTPQLEEKLAHLPARPGVYQHKDAEGKVLYVGKAKNLRSRVRSYFQESRPKDGRLQALVSKIADVEVIVTDTEAEALILENNLIKRLKPRYNVNLRDDKTYPFICITNERFPRVFPTRRIRKDGSKYFGPYTDARNMRLVLDTIRSLFQLRDCTLRLDPEPIAAGKYQVCLQYHIKRCKGPCVGLQTEEDYNETIRQVEQLLHGKTGALVEQLRAEMKRLAAAMQFEEAAALRDRIRALEQYAGRQKVVSQDFEDRDLFALAIDRTEDVACGVLFKVREGKVVGRQHTYLRRLEGQTDEALMQVLLEAYYAEAAFFPDEVLLSGPVADPGPLEALLRERRGKKVPLRVPERGDKAGLIRMVAANARLLLDEWRLQKARREEGRIPHAVKALQRDLNLPRLPRRIECFDVSHLGGTGIVASCVVFEDGRPRKKEYRTYKVRSVAEGRSDDYQAMREVVARRYRRVLEENGPWPDLVVIDGGKGQLASAVEALQAEGVYGRFPIVGLAKRLEEVFFPGDRDSVVIPRTSSSLQLLQRVRNEAHRFAVTFQRKQRQKRTLHSELTAIPGVGEQRVRTLLRTFGSVRRVKAAPEVALAEVVGPALAARIRAHFDALDTDGA